ncbi:ribosome biogenesis GTPase YlqF [Saccharococcus caldoxylosilyticus]|jgi:ribosome biogenesis GTPase A|uniref:Ribosome biogenesis GTPase A n=1 Tax=Parageobacillus caldoxylosilyticus NBRC 107762 TaxID=1220594 RepID=A0A023DBH0_9BACL|nr:ribosome biogenesis GTPase YlqF [Parageobacillus caldoxylosilyticus]OQP05331.1 ribosome biogenesis GTPase YlqF [Geobacillus sp. 44B]MBB3851382.1 ribosome biogenesis GTPase A [Parageobacillus caldoxylosilyticus]QNU37784.1 ribosome biogenesis GTPase YlqF [Geobacillus sp. 44B]QXJ37407.1 Ribosome biogenesis GTPase A [Parageobacillus caldoxylosilyticus]BDG35123.1 ribosome biogenesis GTPase A [Parageobacillus caldoxylosilyticus]
MTIQWFPGHMAKAKREVQEKLKLIDIVFELLDARIPLSSRNPMIHEILGNKPRIVLLNKADMADETVTEQWIAYFERQQLRALAIDAQTGTGIRQIVSSAKEMLKDKFAKMAAKGIKNPRPMRALIVGIPNVGKSTLINRLAGKNIAKTGDKPGVTKAQQWIKVGKEMELLDTPGILWPKFEDEEVGLKLATTGAIKDTILNLQDVAVYALNFLKEHYPERLKERYSLDDIPEEIVALFDAIGKRRGCLVSGGAVDYDKVAEIVLHDIRTEKLGRISFESPAT